MQEHESNSTLDTGPARTWPRYVRILAVIYVLSYGIQTLAFVGLVLPAAFLFGFGGQFDDTVVGLRIAGAIIFVFCWGFRQWFVRWGQRNYPTGVPGDQSATPVESTPAPPKIESFSGDYRFLSNFWPVTVVLDGCSYASVEHAYQAAKTTDAEARLPFQDPAMTASKAKRAGAKLPQRPDWPEVKLPTMKALVRQKFSQSPLREMLLATGDAEIIEGNYWGDVFWGVCNGTGTNHLGKIIMDVRNELKI